MPARLRIAAGIVDTAILAALTVAIGNKLAAGVLGLLGIFMGLRFFFEVVFLGLTGRTPGRVMLKLYVSSSRLWPTPPGLRRALIRHLVKSGDLLFAVIIALTAIGASVGVPHSSQAYVVLVLVVPLTVAAHVGFIATPLVLLGSLLHNTHERPYQDQWADTYVFATASAISTNPVIFTPTND